jgi:IclR family KDG regulon transcriptional repressor
MVNSVFRALDILKSLGDGLETLSDIAGNLNLKKTTTYRLLKALETSGFVVKDPITRHYYIGPAAISLAYIPGIAHQRLIVYSLDEMKYLQRLSGESVALWVKVGTQRTILEELPSNYNIRYTLGKGFSAPMHYGTGGKIMLSELPESERQMILNGTKLVTRENEMVDKETLLSELKKIKQQGYVITIDETIEGAGGISVPIENYVCPAALSVFGPKERFRKDVIMSLVKEIKESAERISRKFLD